MDQHQDLWNRCIELAGAGRLADAEEQVARLLRENPEDGHAWQSAGLLRHRMGDSEGGRDALETAGLLIPLSPMARLALAECLARTGHSELAGNLYRDLATDGGCPDALLPAVAAGLGQIGEYGAALGACIELVRRSPGLAEAHFGVAFYLRRLGRPVDVVLPVVARAHELAPDVPLYRISLATLLDHVGRRDEAREILRDLDLDAVSCRGCLRRMSTIFREGGEAHRGEACRPRGERDSAS